VTSPTARSGLTTLYLCYLDVEEPLVHTQVVPYLAGLADAGHRPHLLTFDAVRRPSALIAEIFERLRRKGIQWHRSTYHKRPSLPATMYDVMVGAATAIRLTRRYGIDVLHVRGQVPGAMALGVLPFTRQKFVFDMRGLLAEEYVDAGTWKHGGLPYRITKWTERRCFHRAETIVVLTERARRESVPDWSRSRVHVIPTCADVDAFQKAAERRDETRRQMGLVGRTVLAYVGKAGG
jgi:hypothetical protein